MAPPYGTQTPPPGASSAIGVVMDNDSWDRTQSAVMYVERQLRGGKPIIGRGIQSWTNPGFYFQATSTITAASGMTLGSGNAKRCTRSGTALSIADDEEEITVYNAGGELASGTVFSGSWTDGDWSTCVAPCPVAGDS